MERMPWWRLIPAFGWAVIGIVAIILLECYGEKPFVHKKPPAEITIPSDPLENLNIP